MEIEEVAATHPEKIVREWTDPALGLQPFQARNLAFGLGLSGDQFKAGVALILNLFRAYLEKDCSLAEINPLVVTRDGRVMALDAKLNFDDNALYRHQELVALRDTNEETPLDVEASKYGLNYIKLDGSVGCMVNGAGLAMATMDIVKLAAASPPTSSTWAVAPRRSRSRTPSAFSPPIRPSRPCSSTCSAASSASIALAEGIIAAVKKLGLKLPVVLRAEGHQRRAGQEDARGIRPRPRDGRRHGRGRQEGRRASPGARAHEHPRRQGDAACWCRASPARKAPSTPSGCKEYGTQVVGGVTPGKGGTTHEGFPSGTPWRRLSRPRAPTAR